MTFTWTTRLIDGKMHSPHCDTDANRMNIDSPPFEFGPVCQPLRFDDTVWWYLEWHFHVWIFITTAPDTRIIDHPSPLIAKGSVFIGSLMAFAFGFRLSNCKLTELFDYRKQMMFDESPFKSHFRLNQRPNNGPICSWWNYILFT